MTTWYAVLSAVFGGTVTGYFTFKGVQVKANARNENVYARHFDEVFQKMSAAIEERERLSEEVMQLRSQLQTQTSIIEQLTRQVKELSDELENYKQKGEKDDD